MTNLIFQTKIEITAVTKPTKAKLFADVQVGDVLFMELPLRATAKSAKPYGSRKGNYALYITVTNERTGDSWAFSQNDLRNRLSHFEWVETNLLLGDEDATN